MKLFKDKLFMTAAALSLVLIIMIVMTSQGRTRPTAIEGAAVGAITPVQKILFSTGEFFKNTFGSLFELKNLKQENEQLKKEVETLKAQNRQLTQMAQENDRLKSLLDFKDNNKQYEYMGANITGKDPGNWFDVYTIDRGSRHGVVVNDAVIVGKGFLVGRIIEVGHSYSKFMALIDERSSVSVVVNRTRDLGIVSGSINSDITAVMPMEADIVKGDDIVTSGYSTFPKDLYIGKVKSVQKEERKLQKVVLIEPAADFKRLEEVFVIKHAGSEAR